MEQRLIDANAIKLEKGFFEKVDNVPKFYEWISKQPTVDAVPVVRCGECKYFIENTWECVRLSDRFGDEYSDARVYPEYYCADGERKEKDDATN